MNNALTQLKTNTISAILMAAVVISPSSAYAAANSDAGFSEFYLDEKVSMRLQGEGTKSVVYHKVFKAAYYKDTFSDTQILGMFPKRIEIEYFVNIPGRKVNRYTVARMKENTTKQEYKEISERVDIMNEFFVDLKPGDRYSLTFIPGVGTEFAYNNELVGVISGSDFAKALFAVWVGDKPFDKRLKNKILGFEVDKDQKQDQLAMRARP